MCLSAFCSLRLGTIMLVPLDVDGPRTGRGAAAAAARIFRGGATTAARRCAGIGPGDPKGARPRRRRGCPRRRRGAAATPPPSGPTLDVLRGSRNGPRRQTRSTQVLRGRRPLLHGLRELRKGGPRHGRGRVRRRVGGPHRGRAAPPRGDVVGVVVRGRREARLLRRLAARGHRRVRGARPPGARPRAAAQQRHLPQARARARTAARSEVVGDGDPLSAAASGFEETGRGDAARARAGSSEGTATPQGRELDRPRRQGSRRHRGVPRGSSAGFERRSRGNVDRES